MNDEIDIMARTLWGEARSEGERGMQAVANVILYRAEHPGWWGVDIETVCKKKYQFSCWLQNDPNREKLIAVDDSDPEFAIALKVARQAIDGELEDITNGATHYKVTSLPWPADWGAPSPPVAVIGHHSFFRMR
jgi:N-acetylmuramoyl-L-alanine amidase